MLKYFLKTIVIISVTSINFHTSIAQFTRQDTLRGSIGNGRNWWNVKQYNLSISIDIVNQSISGTSQIVFDIAKAGKNRFRILRGLNKEFYHKTINSKDVEKYIIRQSGKDQSKIFNQYLRTIQIPELEYKINGFSFSYRWANCIKGFKMPVKIFSGGKERWITPEQY